MADAQPREPRKVAVGGPQLADAVLEEQRRDVAIVNQVARGSRRSESLAHGGGVGGAFSEHHQGGGGA